MTPDWSQVTVEHVRQACALFDSGAETPRRPAQSTFLLWDGKPYPAKFIRGLAYRLATGRGLDPNVDYSGGQETARFFQKLGLSTQNGSRSVSPPVVQSGETRSAPSSPRLEPQKQALANLLGRRFGAIVIEAEFPWLTVPRLDAMDGSTISSIYDALQAMRGYTSFATFGRSLCCDFYVPAERLIIEYDERQHFTRERAKALELYPSDLTLGFDRDEWIATCRSIQASDPTPPYRDEQRAFYDSLRDILAARNGIRLIRLRHGTFDWTGTDGESRLSDMLSGKPVLQREAASTTASSVHFPGDGRIGRLALISHDYNVPDSGGRFDYAEHFGRINRLCDDEGCDTILFALYTWDRQSPHARDYDTIFNGLSHVQRVILEVGQPPNNFDHVEVWLRGQQAPVVVRQRFATSTAAGRDKQAFLDDLPERQIADGLLVLCGETNIASLVRGSDDFYDPFHFANRLRQMNVRLVLNPIHDYMRRYEMREKRRYYSRGDRTVISVWNQGKRNEAYLPWTVFHDGTERTEVVRELSRPFVDRPDIRVGVLDMAALTG